MKHQPRERGRICFLAIAGIVVALAAAARSGWAQSARSDTGKVAKPVTDSADPKPATTKPATTKPATTSDTTPVLQVDDKLQIATGGPLRNASCRADFDKRKIDPKAKARLTVSLVRTAKETLGPSDYLAAGNDVVLLLNDDKLGVIQAGDTLRAFDVPLKSLVGAALTVLYVTTPPGTRFVCAVAMRSTGADTGKDGAAKEAPVPNSDSRLFIASGVEFASADGFQSQQTRVPVMVTYGGTLGAWNGSRLTFVSMADAGATQIPQRFLTCRSTPVAAYIDTARPAPTAAGAAIPCRASQSDSLGPRRFLVRPYSVSRDTLREDSTAVTSLSWRLSGLLRYEVNVGVADTILIGPMVYGAFETNPSGASARSLGQSWRIGVSFRQLNKQGGDRFEFHALYGSTDVFGDSTSTTYAHPLASDSTLSVAVHHPVYRPADTWLLRAYLVPVDGFILRVTVQLDGAYGNIATISMLKTLKIDAALSAIGIK